LIDGCSASRGRFRPKFKEPYYFLIFDKLLGSLRIQKVLYWDTPRDRQNVSMHNCFATEEDAEAYQRELEDMFE
jgi:hypothetical protein